MAAIGMMDSGNLIPFMLRSIKISLKSPPIILLVLTLEEEKVYLQK